MLDKESQQPLYQQLMKEIRRQLFAGIYKAGDKIPTEKELSAQYLVSRITVRRTVEELCKQGYLVKQQGRGTFVESPKIYRRLESGKDIGFSENCRNNGREPSSHVIRLKKENPKNWPDMCTMEELGKAFFRVDRILSADDMPVIYERMYLPVDRFIGFRASYLENGSMFNILKEKYGVCAMGKSDSTIEISIAPAEMISPLRIASEDPVLLLKSLMHDGKGTPLYISEEYMVGSRYRLSF